MTDGQAWFIIVEVGVIAAVAACHLRAWHNTRRLGWKR